MRVGVASLYLRLKIAGNSATEDAGYAEKKTC